jgi:hypothetical protein
VTVSILVGLGFPVGSIASAAGSRTSARAGVALRDTLGEARSPTAAHVSRRWTLGMVRATASAVGHARLAAWFSPTLKEHTMYIGGGVLGVVLLVLVILFVARRV